MIGHPGEPDTRQTARVNKIPGKVLFLFFLVLTTVLAACGGNNGSGPAPTGSKISTLRVVAAPSQGNPDNFNPYFTTNNGGAYGAQGFLYETLLMVNSYTGQPTNWLASNYSFSSDLTQLTFTIRPGVKWSDGQALTSQDVVFSFNLMKQYPALDSFALWSSMIKSVTAPDNNTAVFTLQHPDNTAVYRIGGQTFIVPQHAWQSVSDPVKFANDTPVVTGPYTLASHNAQLITYKKNPSYWGTRPAVDQIQVPTVADNSTAVLQMAKGNLDWMGSGWLPSLDPAFVGKDPQHNHHWFAPSNTVMLYMNLQKYPFNLLPVRQAISLAINRPELQQGAAQYAPPANPSGVLTPNYQSWIDPQYASQNFTFDGAKAESTLQSAGFTKGSDGIYADKSGKKLSFSLTVVNGWSDWDSDTQFLQKDLKAVGINAQINTVGAYTPYITALQSGNYDAAISWTNGGPTPFYAFNDMLYSGDAGGAGKASSGTNFERWSNPATDALLKQYTSSNDPNAQKQAMYGLEKIMVEQMPTIPLTYNPYWMEYTTTHFTGWPDASNAYDVGAPYTTPSNEDVVLHLHPVS